MLQHDRLETWARKRLAVIFVTQAVEEAVLMSDRVVVVVTAKPERVDRELTLKLSPPRDIVSIQFNQVRRDISQFLPSHSYIKGSA